MFKVSGPDPVWVSSVMNRALPGEIFPGQAQPNIVEEEEQAQPAQHPHIPVEEPAQPAQHPHIPVEEPVHPVNNVKMAYLDGILEDCPPGISDDSTICNRIRKLVFKGNTLSSQFIEQDLKDLVAVYQLEENKSSYKKIMRLLNLDEKARKNVNQKVSRRADEAIRLKGNKASTDCQRRKQEFLKAARAQQNI
jgi:hypothetical protein